MLSPENVKPIEDWEEVPRLELLELLEALEEGRSIIQGTATCLPLLLEPELLELRSLLPPVELLLWRELLLPVPELEPVVPEVAPPEELELLFKDKRPNSILPV